MHSKTFLPLYRLAFPAELSRRSSESVEGAIVFGMKEARRRVVFSHAKETDGCVFVFVMKEKKTASFRGLARSSATRWKK